MSQFLQRLSHHSDLLASRLALFRSFGKPSFVRGVMTSTNTDGMTIKFGPFEVTKQVFLTTPHSYGLVNLKPLLPGHVLICPLKPHKRLLDMSPAETADLFATVQQVQKLLAKLYFPDPSDLMSGSFTVALQDGAEAGQTIPHVHVHVIPRKKGDMGEAMDEIYVHLSSEEANVGGALWDQQRPRPAGRMPRIEDAERNAQTMDQMIEEAGKYKTLLEEMGIASSVRGSERL
ncbi:HIT domain-containing protein [Trichoderma guizhouense]|uniref:Bis(5'-adenosyl)-triphosphatase n=1 Tax=Trichoderma guizhouense TaxID=1491466 RepID=A0A1T3CB84_9HYPO|nr:HIT domain-containing protein [Trichoderma guizhouense]